MAEVMYTPTIKMQSLFIWSGLLMLVTLQTCLCWNPSRSVYLQPYRQSYVQLKYIPGHRRLTKVMVGRQPYYGRMLPDGRQTNDIRQEDSDVVLIGAPPEDDSRAQESGTNQQTTYSYTTSNLPPVTTRPFNSSALSIQHSGTTCDFCLDEGYGNITSYEYPENYRDNLYCTYRVVRKKNACALRLKFHDFEVVGSSSSCTTDYLYIPQTGDKFCGRLTGRQEIVPFPLSEKEITFVFKSNGVTSARGFWIEIESLSHNCPIQNCDTRDNRLTGVIKSHTEVNVLKACTYVIVRKPGYCSVAFTPLSLSLPLSPGCSREYIDINDQRICGDISGLPRSVNFNTRGEVRVVYTVFGSSSVRLQYEQQPCTTGTPAVPRIPSCGDTINQVSFNLFSPSTASTLDCSWVIKKANSRVCELELRLESVELSTSAGCSSEYLEVEGRRLCGPVPTVQTIPFTQSQQVIKYYSEEGLRNDGLIISGRQLECNNELNCDAFISSPFFQIQSPRFPSDYPPNIQCRYFVQQVNDSVCKIELTYLSFDLENSVRCSKDYLQVGNRRLCGSKTGIELFDVEGRSTAITFKTDAFVSGSGFHILGKQVSCSTPSARIPPTGKPKEPINCDSYHSTSSFTITSRNYPKSYDCDLDCSYQVIRAPGVCWLEIDVTDMDIELSDDCLYDYLQIGNRRLCGTTIPGKLTLPFDGNFMKMVFHSDRDTSGRGFRLLGRQIQCSLPSTRMPPTYTPASTRFPSTYPPVPTGFPSTYPPASTRFPSTYAPPTRLPPTFPLPTNFPPTYPPASTRLPFPTAWTTNTHHRFHTLAPPPSCEFCFYNKEGEVHSYGYPNQYRNNMHCSYKFKLNPGYCAVQIRFQDFKLVSSTNCGDDYVLMNGQRYCGEQLKGVTARLQSRSNTQVSFDMYSDYRLADRGFFASFQQLPCSQPDSCGGVFREPEVIIQSPNYPFNYPNNVDCVYTVTKYSSAVCNFQVSFLSFDIADSVGCSGDYLEVSGRKFCGGLTSSALTRPTAQPQQLNIKFHSDSFGSGKGFKIRVRQLTDCAFGNEAFPQAVSFQSAESQFRDTKQLPPECSSPVVNVTGRLHTPGYPKPYPADTHCNFVINRASSDMCWVELEIKMFQLEDSPDCENDFLMIGERRMCGNHTGETVRAQLKDKPVILVFHTDDTTESKGIDIHVKQIPCK